MFVLFRRSKAVPLWLTSFVLLCILYVTIGDVWVTSISGLMSGSERTCNSESEATHSPAHILEEESESRVDCRNVPGGDRVMVVLKVVQMSQSTTTH